MKNFFATLLISLTAFGASAQVNARQPPFQGGAAPVQAAASPGSPAAPVPPPISQGAAAPLLQGAAGLAPLLDPTGAANNAGAANHSGPPESANFSGVDGLSRRDPFRLPEYLVIKLRQKNAMAVPIGNLDSIEPIRRWPLGSYQLVGIIWDVKKPKAMFMDRINSIHMLQVNDFIGNAKGVIVAIQSGSVTVLEGKIPQVIKLKK